MLPRPRLLLLAVLLCLTVGVVDHASAAARISSGNPAPSAPVPAVANAQTPTSFDVAADFSPTTNPNGAWSYGWSVSRGSAFSLATNRFNYGGLDVWGNGCCPSTPGTPAVWHNGSASPITILTLTAASGGLFLHPGPNGENAVVRWSAPATGTYQVTGAFTGIDFSYPTTTDVAVRHGGDEPFSGFINSSNVPLAFSFSRSVAAGETIDFTVGYGANGTYWGDSTSLAATISEVPPPAWRFPWAYGADWKLTGGPHDWGAVPASPNPTHAAGAAAGSGLDFKFKPDEDRSVYAAAAGNVYFVGPVPYGATCKSTPTATPTPAGAANVVKIRHSGGWETWYLHLASFAPGWPTTGTLATPIWVDQGRYLGQAGSTGACAIHLHVELCGGLSDGPPVVYCTQDAQHRSWDGHVIDGWTVHMSCGDPSIDPNCSNRNFDGYMSGGLTPFPPYVLPGELIGHSSNPTYVPFFWQTFTLQPRATVSFVRAVNTGLQRTRFSWRWGGSTVDSWLVAPDGTTIDPATTDPNVVHGKDATSEYYDITNPQAGQWTLYSYGADIPEGGEPVTVEAGSSAPPLLVAVGGIAEQPDVASLPSSAVSSDRSYARYILGAAAALIAAAAGAAGWRKRRV